MSNVDNASNDQMKSSLPDSTCPYGRSGVSLAFESTLSDTRRDDDGIFGASCALDVFPEVLDTKRNVTRYLPLDGVD